MSALAFKTVAEANGDLVYIRVYSGELKPGETYTNTTNGKKERIARFYRMMGDKRISLEKAGPGDIVAAMGLTETYTGNTLCDPDQPVALEAIQFPKPVIAPVADVQQDAGQRQGRRGAEPPGPRRPDAEDAHRRRDEGHHPLRDGRAAPGNLASRS